MCRRKYLRLFLLGMLSFGLLSACSQSASSDNVRKPYAKTANTDPVSNLPGYLPQKFTPNFTRFPLIASKSKKIVHRRDCALTDAIPTADRDYFRAFRSADAQGYKACDACRPDLP